MDCMELGNTYLANTYARFPVVLDHGSGALLYGEDGKKYIDLGAGIAVNSFGCCDPGWVSAVEAQLHRLAHTSNLYHTAPPAKLAQMLCERTGMKKVFFCNSGAEANECAIKCARKYSSDRYGPDRFEVVSLRNSFHGRTLATLTATGQDALHVSFGPFPEGFRYVPANDAGALEEALDSGSVCAVMMELVQGEGGVIPLEKDYVQRAAALCEEHDALLIIDEVQTGNGRTGTLYAFEQYGVKPDIVTTAKGLAGGLPFGCAMMGEKVKNTFTPGSHGSTFGGNPVCAAGAVYILSHIDGALLAGVRRRGDFIRDELTGAEGVKSVSGLGLMIGVETLRPAKEVADRCLQNGVLVLTAKTRVRLLPPLNIDEGLLAEGIRILKEAAR